jgi:hypothetical protein
MTSILLLLDLPQHKDGRLQNHIDSLPYSRQLYTDWHKELFASSSFSTTERAVRWFYVLHSNFDRKIIVW